MIVTEKRERSESQHAPNESSIKSPDQIRSGKTRSCKSPASTPRGLSDPRLDKQFDHFREKENGLAFNEERFILQMQTRDDNFSLASKDELTYLREEVTRLQRENAEIKEEFISLV